MLRGRLESTRRSMAPPDDSKSPDDLLQDPLLRPAPVVEGFKVLEPAVLYAKIGKGGMGVVYRGRHYTLDLDVAVKCLKPSLVDEDEEFVKRFEREARLAASIAHQNVVRVMDVQQKNGLHYLVMEFVRGETAAERVARKGRLSEKEALAILLGTTAGLAEAHQRGIVHRDIKPENIMISLEGRVKLADLGLARSIGSVDGRSVSISASGVMGTPQYMPPEQWEEAADVTPAADIWALGATFYYLVTGHAGIAGTGTLGAIGKRIQESDYPTLRAERPELRPEVHALFERCVARDPKDRYADARVLLRELKKLATDDEEILLDPATGSGSPRVGTVTPPPKQTLLRIRAQVETVVSSRDTELEPAGGFAPRSEANTVPSPARAAPASPARSRSLPFLLTLLLLLLATAGAGYAAGWFQPAGAQDRETRRDERESPPPVQPRPEAPNPETPAPDPKAAAAAAFARGRALLPQKGQLDAAVAALEEALRLDADLADAKPLLAGALAQQAKALGESDLDAAFTLCSRAAALKPGDAVLLARHEELRGRLASRLAAGLAVTTPKPGSFLTSRQLLLEGTADSPNLRLVRFALVPGKVAPAVFPTECTEALLVAGVWSGAGTCAADGEHLLCVQGEDGNGVTAQFATPVRVVVDTQDPVLLVQQPLSNGNVGAKVAVGGTVTDALPCTVTVNGQPAQVDGERWSLELTLRDGPQELVVEAKDAAGRSAAAVQRSIVVDAVAPVLRLAALPKVTKDTQVTVSGTVLDLGAGELRVDGTVVTPGADGAFTATVPLGEDRAYTIEVAAKDLYGNRSSQQVAVRRDTVAPVVEWTSPDPSKPVPAGEVEVRGTVQDAGDVASVTVNGQPAMLRGSSWSAKLTVVASSGGKATSSTRVAVVAIDGIGNRSEPLVRELPLLAPFRDRIGVDFEAIAAAGIGFDGLPKRIKHKATGLEFVLIPPGTFDMGSPIGEAGRRDDETRHKVTLTEPFYLAETEVSVAQWRGYAQATGYKTEAETSGLGGFTFQFNAEGKSEYPRRAEAIWSNPLPYFAEKKQFTLEGAMPVTQVSWNDAMSFCGHYTLQLPTEAQWEYACRAGQSARFWWGDLEEQGLGKINAADRGGDGRVFNFGERFDFDDGYQFMAPVDRKVTPNAFGLKDMLGNVWEWCADRADYTDGKVVTNTYGGSVTDPLCLSGAQRVYRGGSWVNEPAYCRSAFRVSYVPSLADYFLGFRPALVARPPVK